jgi:hypothetical protein
MSATIAGVNALSLELRRPKLGAWQIDSELDTGENIAGSVVVDIDGSKWQATVLESRVYAGKCFAWLVAGQGGLQKELEARQYIDATLGDICRDILSIGSETISGTTSDAVLARKILQWERLSGRVGNSLLHLLDRCGLVWRMLPDGTVWIGEDTWAAQSPEVTLMNEDWSTGIILLAPGDDFNDVASLSPGQSYAGHRIEQVVHRYGSNSLRTSLHTSSLQTELDRFLEPVRREIDYATCWFCVVEGQNADGTLRVTPEDERLRGKGLDNVPILTGLPGFEVKVQSGAAVVVMFEDGDPAKPRAVLWKSGDEHVTSIEFKPNGTGVPLCKVGDTVEVTFPMGLVLTSPTIGVANVMFSTPAKGVITGPGNSKLLV